MKPPAKNIVNKEGDQTPQDYFRDMYTVAYEVLDDAKNRHKVLKLYKGSHLSSQPHEYTLQFGAFFAKKRQGLFSFACSMIDPNRSPQIAMLAAFDKQYQPRLSTLGAFQEYYNTYAKLNETREELFSYVCSREHKLGAYRGGGSGLEDETLAFIAQHFQSQGFPTGAKDILVFGGGFKGAMMAFCAAVFCQRQGELLQHKGGLLLVPEGYYQSLRLIPPLFSAKLQVLHKLTAENIQKWLIETNGLSRRAIYIPLINNANGDVLTRGNALRIAEIILTHNKHHPFSPVYVIGDDVYAESYLAQEIQPQPIGSVKGSDFGRPELGDMFEWSLSIITSSKTFALPTSRISFATTGNKKLGAALAHYRTVLSYGRVPQFNELTAVAAICLTPKLWIEDWNTAYRQRLQILESSIRSINQDVGTKAFTFLMPQGGWYASLRISRELMPSRVNSNIAALSIFLNYGMHRQHSGLGLLSGELFGYMAHKNPEDMFTLRGSIAISDSDLQEFANRLHILALTMTGPQRNTVTDHCMRRLHKVAPDIDQILQKLEY